MDKSLGVFRGFMSSYFMRIITGIIVIDEDGRPIGMTSDLIGEVDHIELFCKFCGASLMRAVRKPATCFLCARVHSREMYHKLKKKRNRDTALSPSPVATSE